MTELRTSRDGDEAVAIGLLHAAMFEPRHRRDPYAVLAGLHDVGEMTWMPEGWLAVYGYDAANELMRSPAFGRENPDRGSRVMWPIDLTAGQRRQLSDAEVQDLGLWLQLIDAPEHTRQRKLVNKAFSPRRIQQLRQEVERTAGDLVDALVPDQPTDVVSRLAYPLPAQVMGDLVGLPIADRQWFATRARAQRLDRDPTSTFDDLMTAARARLELAAYVRDLIAERRTDPRDDVASALIQATEDGDRLAEPELVSLVTMLYIAGYSTTGNLLSNGLHALLTHPGELARLRSDRSLLPRAVEEMIRFDPPVISVDYHAAADTEFRDVPVPTDTEVHVFLGVANRDPRVIESPDRFDVGRTGPGPLSFGAGPHHCLGAALARLEVEVALAALLDRFDEWEVSGTEPPQLPMFNYRGFDSLEITFR